MSPRKSPLTTIERVGEMADTEIKEESLSNLVARGSRALETIRMRERAARYAADALELEQAISLARQGSPTELVRWMARWRNDSEWPPAIPNQDHPSHEDSRRPESWHVRWEQSPVHLGNACWKAYASELEIGWRKALQPTFCAHQI